ncbi:succinate dehydrogenase cytochrome b560 subunit [Diplodia corticola]|uniref:Succinate dehydrogenase cytochrome b560 subunit n=1 Tax=Diplodia corticola TaxID=236234 RepID=A0A1J9QX29_9PEZI|nr:succinate dehydrogenase cytochrome b560 subunit [Diplodia corticola]OJD32960.1 succinate dehydrogenase cytochrome b560 subunit [Diplodia corticola]
MFAQRAFQASLRRAAGPRGIAAPAGILTQSSSPRSIRPVATQNIPAAESNHILEKQRLNRPVAPHLSIYKPQITWYSSGFHRITGCVVSGGMYVFFMAYAIAPLTGWHLESQSLAAAVAAWPIAAKVGLKTVAALPFAFHSINGLRHIAWDFAVGINNKKVIQSGWTAIGLTAVSTLALAFYGN